MADSVSPSDVNDYYRFVLPYRSSLNLSLSGLTANANVQLLNGSSGGLIQESTNQGALAESLNTTLEAGVYYVRVFPATTGITTNYSLNLQAQNNVRTDIIWRNYATNAMNVWQMNGTTAVDTLNFNQTVADTNWRIEGTEDFTNDGQADIIWRNYVTGSTVV